MVTDCCETELPKQSQFSLHVEDVRVGRLFRTSVHAFVSNGWVQPSQAIPTPTLLSSISWCLLAHTMPSLFSPYASPLTLSAVAMLLLCFASKMNERKQERKEKDVILQQRKQNNKYTLLLTVQYDARLVHFISERHHLRYVVKNKKYTSAVRSTKNVFLIKTDLTLYRL